MTKMEAEILETPWVCGDDDFATYACESCAREFASDRDLVFSHPFTTDDSLNGYAYCDVYGEGETDYPVSCDCGQWLSVNLTPDGMAYVRENDLPEFVKEYYLAYE